MSNIIQKVVIILSVIRKKVFYLKKLMLNITVDTSHVHFDTVAEAFRKLNVETCDKEHKKTCLVWHDSLKDDTYFDDLRPWQVINRIPGANVLCRKVPFFYLIKRLQNYFPKLYDFIPKTYILPTDSTKFKEVLSMKDRTYIVKPDSGSLGEGIEVLKPGSQFSEKNDDLYVAQEYIESLLIDRTKFDLRVYVLVTSVNPLKIYVCKDGLARFCSEKVDSGTKYSMLTNVTLNKNKEGEVDFSKISRPISDVIPELRKMGIDTDKLWADIEKVITLTILSSQKYLAAAENLICPPIGYSRTFQIFGFDVLIDKNLKPYVIEVNYRPSLRFNRPRERRVKVKMISDAIKLAAPLEAVQTALNARNHSWTRREWVTFVGGNTQLFNDIESRERAALKNSSFRMTYPSNDPDYKRVFEVASTLPLESIPGFMLATKHIKGGEA